MSILKPTSWYDKLAGIFTNGGQATASEFRLLMADLKDSAPRWGSQGGFVDYNNSGPTQPITANTWTTLANDGAGPNSTGLGFLPAGLSDMLDPGTGRLIFDGTGVGDGLEVGDRVLVRHTLSITPATNNQTVDLRHFIGQPGGEYALSMGFPFKMEQGGGQPTEPIATFSVVYMGDNNTLLGGMLPQIRCSGACTVDYQGVYIEVMKQVR